jgi:hypothetical protein
LSQIGVVMLPILVYVSRRGRPQKPQSERAMILKAGTQIE